MPNTFRPRGSPNADPNANYYQDWELTNRPAMIPFLAEYTNTKTGEKSGGMAMPSMVTSPANALWQLVGPQGGMWDIENPQNADALREVNMATLGGEAFPAITRNALAKEAIPNALSIGGEKLLSDTAKPNPLGAALASNADLAATGTGNSLAPRLGEGSPLPNQQHVGQMGEGLQGHSPSLAGQQGQGIHNLMQNGQSSNSSSVTPIGSFLDKNYYLSSGLNPIHEVHDWSKVRALARAAIRGDHVPGYLYEGQPNNGNLLAGTHRAAANELLDMLGYRKRIDHASIDDVMDDPASYGLTQSDADNLRDAVAYADYGEIDNIWDISRDTSLFSDTGRPSLMGSALASEQSQNSIFDILRLNGMY